MNNKQMIFRNYKLLRLGFSHHVRAFERTVVIHRNGVISDIFVEVAAHSSV